MAGEKRLVPSSDGHLARRVGVWSKEKLVYLERYCGIFNRGMQHRWRRRVFIDLFSGPGRCVIKGTDQEIDGSPLIAERCSPPFTDLFFNDLDPNAIEALRARLDGSTTNLTCLNTDCNVAANSIDTLLDRVEPASQLSLCFIDPTNWQVQFTSVAALAQGRRMDLIVVFQSAFMKRAAHAKPASMIAFFGDDSADPEWFRLYEANGRRGRGLTRVWLDHYRSRLATLGYNEFHDRVSIELDNDGAPLYQMLFASKHPRGKDFWGKIAGKQHSGQLRLAL